MDEYPRVGECFQCCRVKLLIDGPTCQGCMNREARTDKLTKMQNDCLYDAVAP